jgi:hypothetical protein
LVLEIISVQVGGVICLVGVAGNVLEMCWKPVRMAKQAVCWKLFGRGCWKPAGNVLETQMNEKSSVLETYWEPK